MFNNEFFSNLPNDPASAAFYLIIEFNKFNNEVVNSAEPATEFYEQYIEAVGLCNAFIDMLKVAVPALNLTPDHGQNIGNIRTFFSQASKAFSQKKIELLSIKARERLQKQFDSFLIYKFTDGDLTRIQELINELRDMITNSDFFGEKHKERLLKRLEELQLELHKKMSSLDKFWGFIMDAGPALGKFGKDAKPFFDRLNELANIIWGTQSITQELPTSTPLPILFHDNPKGK